MTVSYFAEVAGLSRASCSSSTSSIVMLGLPAERDMTASLTECFFFRHVAPKVTSRAASTWFGRGSGSAKRMAEYCSATPSLVEAVMSREKFTLFWHGPFSKWHPSVFTVSGTRFNTAEQFMMYCKAVLFDDTQTAANR